MKIKFMYKMPDFDYSKEIIVEIDEDKIDGMKGYALANYIYLNLENWIEIARPYEEYEYQVLDGKYASESNIPYLIEPYKKMKGD